MCILENMYTGIIIQQTVYIKHIATKNCNLENWTRSSIYKFTVFNRKNQRHFCSSDFLPACKVWMLVHNIIDYIKYNSEINYYLNVMFGLKYIYLLRSMSSFFHGMLF